MARADGNEEQYVLRVLDPELALKLRKALREEENVQGSVELTFQDSGRVGRLFVEGKAYQVNVLDLPTLVESYKTYDDINLVKTGDIGQMLVVGAEVPQGHLESVDGVTPPMRKARSRHLRKRPTTTSEQHARIEKALRAIVDGCTPGDQEWNMEFHDIEEEYVVDDETGMAMWKQVAKGDKGEKKRAPKGGAAAAAAAAAAANGSQPDGPGADGAVHASQEQVI